MAFPPLLASSSSSCSNPPISFHHCNHHLVRIEEEEEKTYGPRYMMRSIFQVSLQQVFARLAGGYVARITQEEEGEEDSDRCFVFFFLFICAHWPRFHTIISTTTRRAMKRRSHHYLTLPDHPLPPRFKEEEKVVLTVFELPLHRPSAIPSTFGSSRRRRRRKTRRSIFLSFFFPLSLLSFL